MSDSSDHARITDIHTVGVPVSDQARSLGFYIEMLGFETRLDATVAGSRSRLRAPRHRSRSSRRPPAPRPASTPASASAPQTPNLTTRRFTPPAWTRWGTRRGPM